MVVARLREERENEQIKADKEEDFHRTQRKEDIDLLCDEQMVHEGQEQEDKPSCLPEPCKSPYEVLGPGTSTPPYSDYTEEGQAASLDGGCFEEPVGYG